jgi:hypothetical protein
MRVYKGKEQSDTTTNHRSLPSVNSNFSLVSTGYGPSFSLVSTAFA